MSQRQLQRHPARPWVQNMAAVPPARRACCHLVQPWSQDCHKSAVRPACGRARGCPARLLRRGGRCVPAGSAPRQGPRAQGAAPAGGRALAVVLRCVRGAAGGRPVELLRRESLAGLAPAAAARVLSHAYAAVVPISPLPYPPLPLPPGRPGAPTPTLTLSRRCRTRRCRCRRAAQARCRLRVVMLCRPAKHRVKGGPAGADREASGAPAAAPEPCARRDQVRLTSGVGQTVLSCAWGQRGGALCGRVGARTGASV